MNALIAQGVGILLISSELPEVLGMSDRVLVMYDGRLVADLPADGGDPGAGDRSGKWRRDGAVGERD